LNLPNPEGCGNTATDGDCGVFFKPFNGDLVTNGLATGTLYQDNPATAGLTYTFTGWAGAEANSLASQFVFALEFLDGANAVIQSNVLDLAANGLFVPNGQPFNYKQYSIMAVAPVGTATVRASASFIGGRNNPAGGGQAFLVDDFTLDNGL